MYISTEPSGYHFQTVQNNIPYLQFLQIGIQRQKLQPKNRNTKTKATYMSKGKILEEKDYILLSKPGMLMRSDFSTFMNIGANKTILLLLIREVTIKDKQKPLNHLIYFSSKTECMKITSISA